MLSNKAQSTIIDSDCEYCKKKGNDEKAFKSTSAVTDNGFKDLVLLPDGIGSGDLMLSIDNNSYNIKNKDNKLNHSLYYSRTFNKQIGSINMLSEDGMVMIVGQFK